MDINIKLIFCYGVAFLTCIAGYTQSLNPNSSFEIDENFVFKHFDDVVVIKEYVNRNGDSIMDTIYSCELNGHGQILRERNKKNHPTIDGILLNNYDTLNRLETSIYYQESRMKEEYRVNNISASVFYYNDFDSISFSEHFEWSRLQNPDKIEENDSVTFLIQGSYKEEGEWLFISKSEYSYNSENRLIKMQNAVPKDFNFEKMFNVLLEGVSSYEYDDQGRVLKYTQKCYANKNSYSETFEYNYNYYPDSTIIINTDTSYYVLNKKRFYSKNVMLSLETETWIDNDGIENIKRMDFSYDQKGRIKEKVLYWPNKKQPKRFTYYYK